MTRVTTTSIWFRTRIAIGSALALLLLACGAPAPEPGQSIRFALASDALNLDPRVATDAVSSRINRLLYDALVRLDEQGRPRGYIARWTQVTSTHYRFQLLTQRRPFVDGATLVAADVAATFRNVLAPDSGSPHRGVLSVISRIEVESLEALSFYLRRPEPAFPAYLAIGIVPEHLIQAGHSFADDPVGSGPFEFEYRDGPGRLHLRRREDRQRFEFITVRDPTVRVLKLRKGEIDMLQNDLAPELRAYLAKQPELRFTRADGANFSYLGFNLADPLTSQLPVRQAIAQAIDRDAIIEHLFAGTARPAAGLFPPEHWVSDAAQTGPTYNPGAAKRLLRGLGYGPERPLRLSYKTSADPFRLRLASVIAHQLAKVGIELDIRSYDWGTFFGDIKAGRFQLYSLTWVGLETPDSYRYIFHSKSQPPEGANRGRYRNAQVDRWLDAARTLPEPADRAALYRKVQARLLQDLPIVPLWYEDHFFVQRAALQGYRLGLHGNYDALQEVQYVRQ